MSCRKYHSACFPDDIRLARVCVVMAGLILATCVASLEADTITVTTDSGGTGGPDCTLRDAITAANTDTATGGCTAGSGADTIELPADATITLTEADNVAGIDSGSNGLPSVASTMIVHGNSSIIERSNADGTPDFRIFHVAAQGDLTLNDLAVTTGFLASNTGSGGGILNRGILNLNDSIVSGNVGYGGGIYNGGNGKLTVTNSTVNGNTSIGFLGGGSGGGILNEGKLSLTKSTVSGNTATSQGGGISNSGSSTLISCTVSGNTVDGNGGGVSNSGSLTLTNTTVSDNDAFRSCCIGDVSYGGGIINAGSSTLTNCTVSGNTADYGGGIFITDPSGPVTLTNSIVANSIGCVDCDGIVTHSGYNIIEDGSCISAPTSRSGDPNVGPLANNGGQTLTHALLPGSIAIDAGDCAGGTTTTDQRGVPRPQGAYCDIGAFELQAAPVPTVSEWGLAIMTLLLLTAGSTVFNCRNAALAAP